MAIAAPALIHNDRDSDHIRNIFLRISNHLARITDIQSALAAVAEEVAAIIPFTHFDICLIDSPDWIVSYEVGIQTRWSRKRTRILNAPVRELLTGDLDYMICSNAMEDPRQTFAGAASEPIFNLGLRSRVHVSMKVMGQLVGTLNISHSDPDRFDQHTLEFAQPLADLLAPYFHALRAIEKAHQDALVKTEIQTREEGLRQGASRLTQALEAERQRIGMDLHDQTLADLTLLMRVVTDESQPLDRTYLANALSASIRDLRLIIEEAVPAQLELFGLSHALSEHMRKATRSDEMPDKAIKTSVIDNTDVDLDSLFSKEVRTAIYRIAQEAINNAINHANPSSIILTIDTDASGSLLLSVRDDGCGFSNDNGGRRSGLAHMETRAQLIRGHLKISCGEETCVTLTVPLPVKEKNL